MNPWKLVGYDVKSPTRPVGGLRFQWGRTPAYAAATVHLLAKPISRRANEYCISAPVHAIDKNVAHRRAA